MNCQDTVAANRPDIRWMNETSLTTSIIDISIPSDLIIAQKYEENIDKYLPLDIELGKRF
jgi:hypothetical protein